MIVAEHRRTLFSDPLHADIRTFEAGWTLAEIVAAFDRPPEFETFGQVYLEHHVIPRELWSRVRPKDGTALFMSCVPQGGDTSQIFALVGAVALVALTGFIGAGGLALMAPALAGAFGAGTIGASIAAATIGIAGTAALSLLTKPAVGAAAAGGAAQGLASAGVASNYLGAYTQIPAVLGEMRVSPPFLAKPYTTTDSGSRYVNGVVGLCGPLAIDGILINDTALADLANVTIETFEGWDDDGPMTLIDSSAFEENVGQAMSQHQLDTDGLTLLMPKEGSYPQPVQYRTARRAEIFRVLLSFPQGVYNQDSSNGRCVILFRIRVRRRDGVGTWINLPELCLNAYKLNPFFQEIVVHWTADESDPLGTSSSFSKSAQNSLWPFAYYANQEWQADSFFFSSGSASPSVNSSVAHVYSGADRIVIFLDPAHFPVLAEGYDVELTRSAAVLNGDVGASTYPAGVYSYQSFSSPNYRLTRNQQTLVQTCAIQSYASFREEYPIIERGLTLIAFRARNLQIQSISAKFTSYVPTWDGTEWGDPAPSSNCAALLRWVLVGQLNARPVPLSIMETLGDFYDHCVAEGLTCNALVTQGTVEDAALLIAQCGDAVLRRSDKWGVVIDKDRSAEGAAGLFGPHNMTQPLTLTKTFITGSQGVVPSYYDASNDYQVTERNGPILMPGIQSSDATPIESASYDGYTTAAGVDRRVLLDLLRTRHRAVRYNWGVHQEHLNNRRGDLVAVNHDFLIDSYGGGRVKSFTTNGGNLVSVTLNTDVADEPVIDFDNVFEVDTVLRLSDLFALDGPKMGLQIRLSDTSIVVVPVSGVSGATLTVDGTVGMPAALRAGDVAAVGPRDRETRRVIISSITASDNLMASIEAFDEASEIFQLLPDLLQELA